MPKEVVKWGKQYVLVHHPATENTSEWWDNNTRYDGMPEDGPGVSTDTKNRQLWLNQVFYAGLDPDGTFGPKTAKAFADYQEFLGVKADGLWGPDTQAAHEAYYAKHSQPTREPNVEVVWSRMEENVTPVNEDPQGWVQIGIDLDKVDLSDRMRYDDDSVVAKTFYTDKLTRHQINDLIRTLKRARNAAYGIDE